MKYSDSTTQADSCPSCALRFRILVLSGVTIAVVGVVAGLVSSVGTDNEHGPLEMAQFALWAYAVLLGLISSGRLRDRTARMFTVWLGVLACLAAARELDLHETLNPEILGAWGVRYRIDWWLDFSVPFLLKFFWGGVGAGIAIALVAPLVIAWSGLGTLLHSRVDVMLLLVSSAAMLAVGWISDDLLRVWTSRIPGTYVEELSELIGVALFVFGVIRLLESAGTQTPVIDAGRASESGPDSPDMCGLDRVGGRAAGSTKGMQDV